MNLPFELPKRHKYLTKYSWRNSGLNMDKFESIYEEYIHQTHCELCYKKFETTIDRHMDHDHNTGEFRNIVCNSCNCCKADKKPTPTNTGLDYITYFEKRGQYIFRFIRPSMNIRAQKYSKDKEIVIEYRDKWFKEHPQCFT